MRALRDDPAATRPRQRSRSTQTKVVALLAATLAFAGWMMLRPHGADPTTSHTLSAAAATAPIGHSRPAGTLSAPTPQSGNPAPPESANPAPSPCPTNRRSQVIVVSIRRQHAWGCQRSHTILSTPVTTGASARRGDATPRGTFAIQGLNRNTTLNTSADGSYPVKYWLPFHLGVWGFHDASWQKIPFGSDKYLTRGSHGCVHVPLPAMRRLFHWASYGTVVRIK